MPEIRACVKKNYTDTQINKTNKSLLDSFRGRPHGSFQSYCDAILKCYLKAFSCTDHNKIFKYLKKRIKDRKSE